MEYPDAVSVYESMDSRVAVQQLPPTAAEDAELMERVAALANDVYAVAEDGLWADQATRTTVSGVAELTRAGQIAVARLGAEIVGCIRVQRLADGVGEFGMLAADPAHRGVGVGRELVRFAEDRCRAEGLVTMQLELLVPRDWVHPAKQFLEAWYTRLGYRVARTDTIDTAYPDLAPLLATPCDFVIYRKQLGAGARR
jgi:ribosomal protein S18 acetylase RimI-like enzyme